MLSDYTSEQIGEMVLFETAENAETILRKQFPGENVKVEGFDDNSILITVGDREIFIGENKKFEEVTS